LQALCARHDLHRIDRSAGEPIHGAEDLQRPHEVELVDGRHRNDDEPTTGRLDSRRRLYRAAWHAPSLCGLGRSPGNCDRPLPAQFVATAAQIVVSAAARFELMSAKTATRAEGRTEAFAISMLHRIVGGLEPGALPHEESLWCLMMPPADPAESAHDAGDGVSVVDE
jgi:hypothetical protein